MRKAESTHPEARAESSQTSSNESSEAQARQAVTQEDSRDLHETAYGKGAPGGMGRRRDVGTRERLRPNTHQLNRREIIMMIISVGAGLPDAKPLDLAFPVHARKSSRSSSNVFHCPFFLLRRRPLPPHGRYV